MLDQVHHARIIKDLDNLCKTAGIPKLMMYKSATEFCDGEELEWVQHFPRYQRELRGLALIGKHKPPPDAKMIAMTAALLRNFIDARVVTVQALLDAHEDKSGAREVPDPTVLMVPNLYIRQGGRGLPGWKMQIIYDILLSRRAEGKVSVLYVEDMAEMAKDYGYLFRQHIETNYIISTR